MQHVKRDTQTKAINTGTLLEQTLGGGAIEMRFKHKDTYRCKKCGYEKTYKSKS
jgi:lipopolysaccharide biosynthesis regulator YciM